MAVALFDLTPNRDPPQPTFRRVIVSKANVMEATYTEEVVVVCCNMAAKFLRRLQEEVLITRKFCTTHIRMHRSNLYEYLPNGARDLQPE